MEVFCTCNRPVYKILLNKKMRFQLQNINIKNVEINNLVFRIKIPQNNSGKNDLKIKAGDKIQLLVSLVLEKYFLDLLVGLQISDYGKIIINNDFEISKKFNFTNSLSYVSQRILFLTKA